LIAWACASLGRLVKKELKKIAAQKIADESFPDVGFRHFESFVPQCMAMKSESPPK
jgi:hypothetical protein